MTPEEYFQRTVVMESGMQMLNAEGKCAVQFGGDPARCVPIQKAVAAMWATPAPSGEAARAFCREFGVRYLLVSHRDAVWGAATGWPAKLPVSAAADGVRIEDCGPTTYSQVGR